MVITTALIPGRPAPVLITEEMVGTMKPGSVIVDLAVDNGGNCALSEGGKAITTDGGVTVVAYYNVPSRLATDASALYAKNLYNFIELLIDKEKKELGHRLGGRDRQGHADRAGRCCRSSGPCQGARA